MLGVGSVIAGKYRLERALARGGMGSVWVAKHLQLDAEVAIKFMAPEYAESSEARARFEREAKASARLRIPNVVQVHDYGIQDGAPYLVMELLEGEDLEARLAREGRIAPVALRGIVDQVCKVLRRAHELGLVHRDLKPANIFLARQGGEELVKVLDFGIAKINGPDLVGKATKTGTLIGSPHYMSPEQVRRSKEIDHRSDLWSLGVITFRCLTGHLPFPGEELGDVLVEICTGDAPRASTLAPDLGPGVESFLSRALTRERSGRFQSAHEFIEAFAASLAATPIAHAPTLPATNTPSPQLPASSAPARGSSPPSAKDCTLAPSGRSLALPPDHRRKTGLVIASVAGALTLGLCLVALTLLRASAPVEPAATQGDEPMPPRAEGPASAQPTSAAPPTLLEEAPNYERDEKDAGADAAPSARAQAAQANAAAPPQVTRPPAPSKTRVLPKQPGKNDDPLKSMR